MHWLGLRLRQRVGIALDALLQSELRIAAFTVGVLGLAVVAISWPWYSDRDFIGNLLAGAHGTILDILIIGLFILWLNRVRDRRERAVRYMEEIEDFREWSSPEAAHRIAGCIRRLNSLGVSRLVLSRCFLRDTDLRECRLANSAMHRADLGGARLRGADLSHCNLDTAFLGHSDLRSANLLGATLTRARMMYAKANGACFRRAVLSRANLRQSVVRGADFRDTDLAGVDFLGADLDGADLRGARNVCAADLLKAKSLAYARIDEGLADALAALRPELIDRHPASPDPIIRRGPRGNNGAV